MCSRCRAWTTTSIATRRTGSKQGSYTAGRSSRPTSVGWACRLRAAPTSPTTTSPHRNHFLGDLVAGAARHAQQRGCTGRRVVRTRFRHRRAEQRQAPRRLTSLFPRSRSSGRNAIGSAVFRIGEIISAPRIPSGPDVAVRRNATGGPQHPSEMHQVPRHERRVAVGEVVLRPAGSRVEVRRAGPRLTDPAGVGLRRDGVADVLQRVERRSVRSASTPSSLPVIRQPPTRP